MYRRIILLLILLGCLSLRSQEGYTKKQLLDLLQTKLPDTTLIDTYNELTWPIYSYDLPDSSFYFGNKALELSTQIGDLKRLSIAHRRIGITYINIGETKTAIAHQEKSYELAEKLNYKKGMQLALNNIGVAYTNNELLNKGLSYYLRSLKIMEETQNFSSASSLYYNCALIYRRIGDLKKSTEFLFRAREISKSRNDSDMIVLTNSNLCANYRNQKMIDSARFFNGEALKYLSALSSTNSKYTYHLNDALLHVYTGDHQKALDMFLKSTPYAVTSSDEITLNINIAEEYNKLGNTSKALEYFRKAYDLSEKLKMYNNLSYTSYAIASIYRNQKDYPNFTKMIDLHIGFKDSSEKYIRIQQIRQQQLEFDYERKLVADSIRFEQKEQLKNAELEAASAKLTKERYFRVTLITLLVAIILFSLFIYTRFRLTNKQKKIIEQQKQIVELKNHEIMDSINYAKRLQTAILPQLNDIKKSLNLDILYLPKDIIGGDFYFFEKHGDHLFFAICDCTGHGIPGAMMSVVCHTALQKSIKEFHLSEPGSILEKTRDIVIASLNAMHQNIKDGMDCSLLVINTKTHELQWAGANNHLWLLQQNEIEEIKADKQPVAYYENSKSFTSNSVKAAKGSLLYLFTDGYGDQFGGPKGKKFKNKSLKELIITIKHLPVEEQVLSLKNHFHNWRGDLDQVDDVAIAAIKL
ncbi:MAG: SpoIIE family protein phosphatase [Bacteroidia bacterium]|nr:SpoIIE family protein phosphatase [Bacteroidia bacterium]